MKTEKKLALIRIWIIFFGTFYIVFGYLFLLSSPKSALFLVLFIASSFFIFLVIIRIMQVIRELEN